LCVATNPQRLRVAQHEQSVVLQPILVASTKVVYESGLIRMLGVS
jgi:hypothetical protein